MLSQKFFSLALLSAFTFLYPDHPEPTKHVLNIQTDAFINSLLKDFKSPGGIGVAVVKKDAQGNWIRESKGYGIATLADGKSVTKDTLFGIGSNSKLFTTLSVGLLVHNESLSPRLAWTTKLNSVLPGFGLEDSVASKQADIIDAMSHRTGMPRHDIGWRFSDTINTTIFKVAHQRPSAEFRKVFQYNNQLYTILTSLPTTLLPEKPSFPQYVKENILDPLNMTSTTYFPEVAIATGRLADGMARQLIHTGGVPFIFRAIPFCLHGWGDSVFGPGGVISSSEDMATWLQMLLLDGRHPKTNVSVIPADIIRAVSKGITIERHTAEFPELSPVVYGGGQGRGTYRGHEYIRHGGSIPGFKTATIRFPEDDLGVAVLSNDEELGRDLIQLIQHRLVDEALDLSPIDWTTRLKNKNLRRKCTPNPTTPRPSNASFLPGDFSRLAGIYYNPGYGRVEICLVSSKNPHASPSCKQLAKNVSTILPGAVTPGVPTYILSWSSLGLSHIRLTHFDGLLFNASLLHSYPTDSAKVSFWTHDLGRAGVHVEADPQLSSFGFTGFWGAGEGVPSPEGATPRERAEVWFDRI